jgi:hypothetical protein
MNGEGRSGMGKERMVLVDRFEIGRDQSGLPFMMVDNIRRKLHMLTKAEDSPGEEDETFRIVEVIAFGCAVKIFPVKELFPTDEINRDILVQMAQIDIGLKGLISHGDLKLFTQIAKGEPGLLHHPVIRHD